jgi:hypothetical protein
VFWQELNQLPADGQIVCWLRSIEGQPGDGSARSFWAARGFGKTASRATSSQGSKPSLVKPETRLSGIPFSLLADDSEKEIVQI